MAGFPSGEAYKVGANVPYLRLPRAFLRHVIALGGDSVGITGVANQLAGTSSTNNVTITVGKFSVTDMFDTNTYAHDPRSDFLNWSVIDAGAFDYAADAWGFTYGAAAEWNNNDWTLRGGVFQLSPIPNGKVVTVDFHQFILTAEAEQRYRLAGMPGKFKLLGFTNRARMGRYRDAVDLGAATGATPDTALVRRQAWRPGASINMEQQVATDVGAFARISFNAGQQEAYEFTEINRSVSAGLSVKGARWGRPDDTVGLAGVVNGLSSQAREYFGAGGIGILIGDGQQRYGAEKIIETTYTARLTPQVSLALNYQHVNNPAYNRDRGRVSLLGMRVHAEF